MLSRAVHRPLAPVKRCPLTLAFNGFIGLGGADYAIEIHTPTGILRPKGP